LENQTKETQLIEERLKSEISKSQKFAEESEKELKDLREVCEKREMEIQKHVLDGANCRLKLMPLIFKR